MARVTTQASALPLYVDVSGEGPPLLFLHGFLGCGRDWRAIDADLPRGCRLIAPDLRGHGHSPRCPDRFRHGEAAVDVAALLDRLGVRACAAIGISGGANTLLHVARARPDLVSAMVLVSAAPHFPAQARAIMRTFTDESRSEAEWAQMRAAHPGGDAQVRALWASARAVADDTDDMAFDSHALAGIGTRTLVVYGDRDPLYPVSLGVELYGGLPDAQLWVVPGGGHAPVFLERGPRFAREARAFLGRAE